MSEENLVETKNMEQRIAALEVRVVELVEAEGLGTIFLAIERTLKAQNVRLRDLETRMSALDNGRTVWGGADDNKH